MSRNVAFTPTSDEIDARPVQVTKVVVTGALWPLGRRVVKLLSADSAFAVTQISRGDGVIEDDVDVLGSCNYSVFICLIRIRVILPRITL